MRTKLLIAATVLAVAGVVGWDRGRSSEASDAAPRPAAVVLVTIDTLRADALSFAGRHRSTSPFLDQLAREGIAYDQAYAPSSWTAPSMASLFTGLDPRSHGVVSGHIDREPSAGEPQRAVQPVLAESLTTLAESFQRAGYATVGAPANLHLASALGFAQGFDAYFQQARFVDGPELNRQFLLRLQHLFDAPWARQWKKRPIFAWVHYFDPHIPYQARQPWIYRWVPDFELKRHLYPDSLDFGPLHEQLGAVDAAEAALLQPLYLSEVRAVDENLRALDDQLLLRDPNVLVIATSDHGEELGDHGGIGHAVTLYEEVVRVPLIVRWPAVLPKGVRVDSVVSLLDIFPTLAQLAGLELPPGVQGKPLPLTAEPSTPADRPLFLQTLRGGHDVSAVRQGKWKLILDATPGAPPVQLFDLEQDPGERSNLAEQQPEVVQRLRQAMTRYAADVAPPPADAGHAEVQDPGVRERLRALGYQ